MNKYYINYQFGLASFWTNETNPDDALCQFHRCARACFGIRKSVGETKVESVIENNDMPAPYRQLDGTHLLKHSGGDTILFDMSHKTPDDIPWKLVDEWGDGCSCQQRGLPELSCEVHEYDVEK